MLKLIKQIFSPVSNPTKMALVVRTDIKMSKGKTSAQCSHASILCYQKSLKNNSQILYSWCRIGQPKIILKIDSENEIQELERNARNSNVIAELVRDAGRTQLKAGTITVLGLGPDKIEKIDKLIKHLKLL